MSLTNPDAIVTEERLAEFYQTIFPYLGGMPDILANKFAKGDLYSTDEKMIGQWIDGKPLYQKTVTGTTNFDGTTAMASFDSTCYIVDMKAYIVSAEKSRQYNPFWYSVNNFWCMRIENNKLIGTGTTAYYNNKDFVATICYTKTTDSAVYIGDDTDYSTTEKIVGTWIDGKPIYQKTVTGLNISMAADGNYYSSGDIDPIVSNIDTLVDSVMYGVSGSNTKYVLSGNEIGIRSNGSKWMILGIDNQTIKTITLQYTKTTD